MTAPMGLRGVTATTGALHSVPVPPLASFGYPAPLPRDRVRANSHSSSYRGQAERLGISSSLLMMLLLRLIRQGQLLPPRARDRLSSAPSRVSAAAGFCRWLESQGFLEAATQCFCRAQSHADIWRATASSAVSGLLASA